MKRLYRSFLQSVKAQFDSRSFSMVEFIKNETYIKMQKFSFDDYKFQQYIVELIEQNPGCTFSIKKCAQIGLSEIVNRIILARMAVKPGTQVLVSYPTVSLSTEVFKTRMAPIISTSPALSAMLDKNNDSASLKRFNNESIMYALGGGENSNSSLINRPANCVVCDETDRQSEKIMSGYSTRMQNANEEDRLWINLSTPTAKGVGIDAMLNQCRDIHVPYTKCPCGHVFLPEYFDNVVLPGFNDDLELLTFEKVATMEIDISKAFLQCPKCKGEINKDNFSTVWKIKVNEKGLASNIGVEINPFAAMRRRSIAAIVKDQINMNSDTEFMNQSLGKVAKISESTVNISDIVFIPKRVEGINILGVDLGKECHVMRGVLQPDTTTHVADSRIVKLPDLEDYLCDVNREFTISAAVIDSQPYTDLVYKLVKRYPRLYSAIYISPNPPKPELWTLKMTDKLGETVRQISINKSLAMDDMVNRLKDFYTFEPTQYDTTITKHLGDMRRVRDYRFDEMIYKWQKSSKGVDHFFHVMVYLYMAGKLAYAGISSNYGSVPLVCRKMNIPAVKARLNRR